MQVRNVVLELPAESKELNDIVQDKDHDIQNMSLSSSVVDGEVKHFVLVVWEDRVKEEHWHVGTSPGRTYRA